MFHFQGLTKKPIFWVLFCLVFVGGCWFSFNYFSQAFPIIDLKITMDRHQALEAATKLAHLHHWGPEQYKQAASFDVNAETKTFIELEGGGLSKFKEILHDPDYSPYTWSVRHFKEHEINEVTIKFTPLGKPYGFVETIAEDQQGPALSPEKARAIAVAHATDEWHIDFTHFAQAETSQEVRPNGRVDHTFVYELTDKKVGEAPYRLQLVVRGDRFTQLEHSLKTPDAFIRRYKEMRSDNGIIAFIALIAVLLFYAVGGLVSLFVLLRRRTIVWKIPLLLGSIIGILQGAVTLNELPLLMKLYPTSLSWYSYLSFILVRVFVIVVIFSGVATLLIMTAESLTRKAFGHHLQLWRIWDKTAGHSRQVLGRTIGSYLILGFDFAFAIGLYYVALRYFGWWSPAEQLYDPNILAHYLPWLSPLALSLSAGLLEECLFRAIPLSCAQLLGKKYGNRKWWMIGAFILQAIIFGAAHATYPAQPAYARLVELIVPSLVFGFLYVKFGLLVPVISHYVYDVVWFALPIFVASAKTLIIDKVIIIIGIFIPLVIVLWRVIRAGKITNAPPSCYNDAWKPVQQKTHHMPSTHLTTPTIFTPANKKLLYGLGCTGLIALSVWCITTRFEFDGLRLKLTRSKAIQQAEHVIAQPSDTWEILASVIDEIPTEDKRKKTHGEEEQKLQHDFVWKTSGKGIYHKLLKLSYLKPYTWFIRFVNFHGDVTQRAEEYQITTRKTANILEKKHILAEDAAVPSLTLDEARTKAHDVLFQEFKLNPHDVSEISASPKKLPHRTDWTFIFSMPSTIALREGQQRISISLAGNTVSDAHRFIFVPEAWKRTYTEEKTQKAIIKMLSDFLLALLMVGALILLAFYNNFRYFSLRIFWLFFGILFIKSVIQAFNMWPTLAIHFTTIEPFSHQLWQTVLLWFVLTLVKSTTIAILVGSIVSICTISPQFKDTLTARSLAALSLGIIPASIASLVSYFSVALAPHLADFSAAGAFFPFLSAALQNVTTYIEATTLFMALIVASDILTDGWQKNKILFIGISLALGILSMGHFIESTTLLACLLAGVISGILFCGAYILLLRYDKVFLPLVTGSYILLSIIQETMFHAYPQASTGGIMSIFSIIFMMVLWTQVLLHKQRKDK